MMRRLLSLFLVSIAVAEQQRVPSLNEISKIDDPVLREVFASSKSKTTSGTEEPPPQQLERQPYQPPRGNYYSGGEVPISHPEPLGPMPAPPQSNAGLTQLVDTGANVFATGANAFYRGAASVGPAFGVQQPANYQLPLLNQAASIFG